MGIYRVMSSNLAAKLHQSWIPSGSEGQNPARVPQQRRQEEFDDKEEAKLYSGNNLRVAFIGNHTPRQCGIATFTADIARAVEGTGAEVQVTAMNDRVEGYDYPEVVRFQVDQHRPESYLEAALYLNAQHVDVVCVQHEYGIFGGESGSHLLRLLRELNAPIVTTLHTILLKPTSSQREVLAELSQLSERLIVMTERGRTMLETVHGIDPEKIKVVQHGIPTIPRVRPEPFCADLGLQGKRLLLTFGLIAPDKGIEQMILAMPTIVKEHQSAFYLVVGATHPHIRAQFDEAYRTSLIELASTLGVSHNVGFIDRFVTIDELKIYLKATSIYVTPYLKVEQITSGTLAYAFGSGKAVVSTPYWHAEELLADGRGILVPFRDPEALAQEVNGLLSDAARLEEVQLRAFEAGQQMQWPVVGSAYVQTFREAMESSRTLFPDFDVPTSSEDEELEIDTELGLEHLLNITDDTGILQHATYSVPNRFEGYCTDDNARLAIVGARLDTQPGYARLAISLQHKGLSFLHHAFNEENGRMRNFMSYERRWYEVAGSEDSHGRATWALGVLMDDSSAAGIRAVAKDLFNSCLPVVEGFTSPRAMAFTLLGLNKALGSAYSEIWLDTIRSLAQRLDRLFREYADEQWTWFEDVLAYDNARLSHALLLAGYILEDDEMISHAVASLRWLVGVQTGPQGCFLPIGSNGFFRKGGPRAIYDQQPVEATATIDACSDAWRLTGDPFWRSEVWRAYRWFHGANSEGQSLIDDDNGGCKDGLMESRVNHNQGAESTLAFLSSVLSVIQMDGVVLRRENRYLG